MAVESSTPVMFSRTELRSIRATLRSHATPLLCPRCRGKLDVHGGVSSSGYQMLHVRCRPCSRVAFIGELPGERWAPRERRPRR